ncbi:MAG: glycosyltransferase family 39 protein, partial [Candidatus Margulisbacteria bacterium]|nr:glycosyltransferase family 39 protein [Candidatus Margulisiibacteriota bacterium]
VNMIVCLAASVVIRLGLASLFPLTADESYYWLWSKHLALSYVDHPPMVALVNYLMTFGHENLFAIRLGAVLITLLVSILIYFLAKEIFESEKVAFWSVVLFQFLPQFAVVWLTQFVELPAVLFWSASLLIIARIMKKRDTRLWCLLAVTLGLGYLSKYTILFFWPCLAIYFWLAPNNRYWLKQKEPYFCFILSLIFFAPIIIWNSQHNWISFAFHANKATSELWGKNVIPFVLDQLVHFTPFLLIYKFVVFNQTRKKDNDLAKLLLCFSMPVFIVFLLLSVKIKVWSHWPSMAYIAAIPLVVEYLITNGKSYKKFVTWVALFTLLILSILFYVSPGIMLHQKEYTGNYKLATDLPKDYKLFAPGNVSSSLFEFYAKRPVYLATGLFMPHPIWGEAQYNIWGIPDLKKGETIIFYANDTKEFRDKATQYFTKTVELPGLKLALVEDYIGNNYKFFKLEDYKEASGHP